MGGKQGLLRFRGSFPVSGRGLRLVQKLGHCNLSPGQLDNSLICREQAAGKRRAVSSVVDVSQPLLGEQAGVGGLGQRGLLHLPAALLQETFQDDASCLAPEGLHLQVEVSGAQQQGVDRGQLDYSFVV